MWDKLDKNDKKAYERVITAFASLSEAFAQKKGEDITPAPIVNSKFQETAFQRAFDASAEDIGNTSYDVAINGSIKYLIGIKTFSIKSKQQKVAQFKKQSRQWELQRNYLEASVHAVKSDKELLYLNKDVYLDIAKQVSKIRNERIQASIEQLRGFSVHANDVVESVYHVLMPSQAGTEPTISVGEIEYSKIDIENIKILKASRRTPANVYFTDGKHEYHYTASDATLWMNFNNEEIKIEDWPVKYVDDAYKVFEDLANEVYGPEAISMRAREKVTESHSWFISLERYSGFNAFNGTGLKNRRSAEAFSKTLFEQFPNYNDINALIKHYATTKASNDEERRVREAERNKIYALIQDTDVEYRERVIHAIMRPRYEVYLRIPRSKKFHELYPDFFAKGAAEFRPGTSDLSKPVEDRSFDLIMEPSKTYMRAFIAQQSGKSIESGTSQSIMGKWLLEDVFQLKPYEPLTEAHMEELGINAIRLYRTDKDNAVHLRFIYIDPESDEKPEDFFE